MIKKLVVGPLRTNCYIVHEGSEAIIIDPGGNPELIIKTISELNVNIKAIIATHCHFDHILAVNVLRNKYDAPFMTHPKEKETLELFEDFLKMYMTEIPVPDRFVDEGNVISIGAKKFYILHTPGHTPGSICLYNYDEKVIFTGDTLFKGCYGRTDFPGGSHDAMMESLRKIFMLIPKDFKVLPGHGRETTIGDEKKFYEYLLR